MNLEHDLIFRKFEKKIYQKIAKAGVIKKMITIPLTHETMQRNSLSSSLGGGP